MSVDIFLMLEYSIDGVGILQRLLLCEWSRETASVVFCGRCLRVCLIVYAFRVPYPSFGCS